jgi:hypothetical protein
MMDGSLMVQVGSDVVCVYKWYKNCIQCLNLGREVERLHHQRSSVNEIIKLLKKDMDLI